MRKNYLIPPASNETEYALNVTKTVIDPSMGQSKKIKLALKNKARNYLKIPKKFILKLKTVGYYVYSEDGGIFHRVRRVGWRDALQHTLHGKIHGLERTVGGSRPNKRGNG